MSTFKTLSLLSSSLFLAGVGLAFIGYLQIGLNIDSANPDDRALASIIQIVAWSMVGASIIPEIMIDAMGLGSGNYHGRHGKRGNRLLSWLQTVLFTGGVITQGIAMKRPWDSDNEDVDYFFSEKEYQLGWEGMLLLSSLLLVFAGILTVISSGCCCCGRRDEQISTRVLVQASSVMFLVAPALVLFSVSIGGFCATCFLGYFMVIFAYGLWIGCGILWIIADALMPRIDGGVLPEEEGQPPDVETSEVNNDGQQPTKPEIAIAY